MTELAVAVHELDELFAPSGSDGASTLLFLPLAHVFARVIQVGAVKARVRLGHSADAKNLVRDLGQFRPTFVLAVPRVFEKVFNTASQNATADGRGRIFDRAAEVAVAWSRGTDPARKTKPSLAVRAQHAAFSRLVYGTAAGRAGRAVHVRRLGWRPAGRAARSLLPRHRPGRPRGLRADRDHRRPHGQHPGSREDRDRRPPAAGTSVRVADDGELLFHGGQVFAGYWHDEAATAEVLEPRRLVPHRRPRRDRRRGVRPHHRAQEGDPGDRRRQERRAGRARGPAARPPARRPVHGRRRRTPVHRRAGHPRPRGGHGVGRAARQAGPTWPRSPTTPSCARRLDEAVDDANKAVSKAESIRKFAVLTGGVDRGGWPAHAEPQAQARRGHARVPRRRRGPLRPLSGALRTRRRAAGRRRPADRVFDFFTKTTQGPQGAFTIREASHRRPAGHPKTSHVVRRITASQAQRWGVLGRPPGTERVTADGSPQAPPHHRRRHRRHGHAPRLPLRPQRRRSRAGQRGGRPGPHRQPAHRRRRELRRRPCRRQDRRRGRRAKPAPGQRADQPRRPEGHRRPPGHAGRASRSWPTSSARTSPRPPRRWASPTNKMAISINLTDPDRVAGFVNPGSEVAIFVTGTSGGGAAAADGRTDRGRAPRCCSTGSRFWASAAPRRSPRPPRPRTARSRPSSCPVRCSPSRCPRRRRRR